MTRYRPWPAFFDSSYTGWHRIADMNYTILKDGAEELAVDAVVECVQQEDELRLSPDHVAPDLAKMIMAELKKRDFTAKEGDVCVFPLWDKKVRNLVVIGLGKKRNPDTEQLRSAGAKAIKAANGIRAKKIAFSADWLKKAKDLQTGVQALVEGVELGGYHFSTYRKRSLHENGKKHQAEEIIFLAADRQARIKVEKGIANGLAFAEGTILARNLVNTPAMDMHPEQMVKVAQSLSGRGTGITCKVADRAGMERLGMKASLAVGQGSSHEPKFVQLTYKPKGNKKVKKIVLIGKALTFDSGGLSIKPADGMIDMKIDMAGAAAVLGVFKALPGLKPNVEVHGFFIAAENMPSGSAYRPGDVVSVMDGTTIEVENTDAEGRITLADALSYASQRTKPHAIIDLATLTGAVIVALGSDISGLFSNDKPLKTALMQAGEKSGEQMWELPLHQPYRDLIKSKIADVKNVGGRAAGVITAALFLEKFVHGTPWAHIDIAGPAYAEKESRPEWVNGGTGWGVRLLLNYLRDF